MASKTSNNSRNEEKEKKIRKMEENGMKARKQGRIKGRRYCNNNIITILSQGNEARMYGGNEGGKQVSKDGRKGEEGRIKKEGRKGGWMD